jgi:hypothetical protein
MIAKLLHEDFGALSFLSVLTLFVFIGNEKGTKTKNEEVYKTQDVLDDVQLIDLPKELKINKPDIIKVIQFLAKIESNTLEKFTKRMQD